MRDSLSFFVNGTEHTVRDRRDATRSLAHFLRHTLRLTGTRVACDEGACGSCTVLIGRPTDNQETLTYHPANACLLRTFQAHAAHVVTVEGLADPRTNTLSAVQTALVEHHGAQCGFCTPGIALALTHRQHQGNSGGGSSGGGSSGDGNRTTARDALCGNLCRCTGYLPLLQAADAIDAINDATHNDENNDENNDDDAARPLSRFDTPVLVDALRTAATLAAVEIAAAEHAPVCLPTTLVSALRFLHTHPNALVIAGGTDPRRPLSDADDAPLLSIAQVPALRTITRENTRENTREEPDALRIGAEATWDELSRVARDSFPALADYLAGFGSPQIRAVGTIGGAVLRAAPNGDLFPLLLVQSATARFVTLANDDNDETLRFRDVPVAALLDETDPTNAPRPGELLHSLLLPLPRDGEIVHLEKATRRRAFDRATVCLAVVLTPDAADTTDTAKNDSDATIAAARIAVAGAAVRPCRLPRTEAALRGPWTAETFAQAALVAASEFVPAPDDAYADAAHRRRLVGGMVQKAGIAPFPGERKAPSPCPFPSPADGRGGPNKPIAAAPSPPLIPEEEQYRHPSPAAGEGEGQGEGAFLSPGKAFPPHENSPAHVTGQTRFLADEPPLDRELTVEWVGSPVAHGRITHLDVSEARALPGVEAVLTAAAIPGANAFGPIVADELLLAAEFVHFVGQPIALIAAQDPAVARRARDLVRLTVEPLTALLTLDQAAEADSFLTPERALQRGDVRAALAAAPHRLSGTLEIGGQEHLYLETQTARAAPPDETGVMTVWSSTQNPTEIQNLVAKLLKSGQHKVVCVGKRMGGAFGGKETQAAHPALMAALVAHQTGRPARVEYSRRDDLLVTGKRHPYRVTYEVGFDGDGTLLALDTSFLGDGGATTDLSPSILDRTLFHADNAYFLPDVRIRGRIARTHKASNTAFRGFGGPQAAAAMENIIEEIAQTLGLDALAVRRRNLYRAGHDQTPYGQAVTENRLPALIDRLTQNAGYDARRKAVAVFNAESTTHYKGLSLTLVKFGISFTTKFLNQGNALVNVYTDGTVQVSTGGTEMGQGLHTKIRQLVAGVLGVRFESVAAMPTSTEKNNNTPPTAASAGTDLNGAAAVKAAGAIRARLLPLAARLLACDESRVTWGEGWVWDRESPPDHRLPFGDLCHAAFRERINLGERAFYATPGLDWDPRTGQGTPFFYYTTGAALAEVRIDRFTGALEVERADILMDIGKSLNPGIDRGQVSGAFVQGMGWVTGEDLRYDAVDGRLLTNTVSHYKIPTSADIPAVFHLDFMDSGDSPPSATVGSSKASSKAVGEPPLLLGIAVWCAVKNALSFAGKAACPAPLSLPATHAEILRRLCGE